MEITGQCAKCAMSQKWPSQFWPRFLHSSLTISQENLAWHQFPSICNQYINAIWRLHKLVFSLPCYWKWEKCMQRDKRFLYFKFAIIPSANKNDWHYGFWILWKMNFSCQNLFCHSTSSQVCKLLCRQTCAVYSLPALLCQDGDFEPLRLDTWFSMVL